MTFIIIVIYINRWCCSFSNGFNSCSLLFVQVCQWFYVLCCRWWPPPQEKLSPRRITINIQRDSFRVQRVFRDFPFLPCVVLWCLLSAVHGGMVFSEIAQHVRDLSIATWQTRWNSTTKALTTEEFFLIIKDRLNTKIKLTRNFTEIIAARGKTKAHLHRFKITESQECPCNGGNRTLDNLIYDCNILWS